MFKLIQEEINLLVKQAHLVGQLEQIHKELTLLGKFDKATVVREQLDSIYPSYLELLKKYTTHH